MAKGLTKKQEVFVAEYLVDLNATRAAIAAGYSAKGAEQMGSVLLRNDKVSGLISQKLGVRLEKLDISAEKILERLAQIAFFDVRKLFNDDGSPKDMKDLDDQTAAALAGLDVVELFDGSNVTGLVKKIRLADRIRCLELLGKYHKLFTDKVEHTGELTLEMLVCGVFYLRTFPKVVHGGDTVRAVLAPAGDLR